MMNEFLSFRWIQVWPWIQISDIELPIGIYLDPTSLVVVGMIILFSIWARNIWVTLCLLGLVLSESFVSFIFFWILLSFTLHGKYKISIASLLGDLGLICGLLFLYTESNGLSEFPSIGTWMAPDKFLDHWFFVPHTIVVPMTLWIAPMGKCFSILVYFVSQFRKRSFSLRNQLVWIFAYIILTAYTSFRWFELLSSFSMAIPIVLSFFKIAVGTGICIVFYKFIPFAPFLKKTEREFDLCYSRSLFVLSSILPFWMRWKLPIISTEFMNPYVEKIESRWPFSQKKNIYTTITVTMILLVLGLIWVSTF